MPKATHHGFSNAWEERQAPAEEPVEEGHSVELTDVEDGVVEEPLVEQDPVVEELQDGPKAAEVRAWALGNDIDVSSRGAIPASVMEAYVAAHQEQ